MRYGMMSGLWLAVAGKHTQIIIRARKKRKVKEEIHEKGNPIKIKTENIKKKNKTKKTKDLEEEVVKENVKEQANRRDVQEKCFRLI